MRPSTLFVPMLLSAALLSGCVTLGTKEPLISDRPDFTESAALIAPGHVQVESGVTRASESNVDEVSIGEVFGRIGLTDRLELRVVPNSYSVVLADRTPSVSGRVDPVLGVKVKFLDGTETPSLRPAISLIAGTSLPIGSTEFRAPHLQPEAKLLLAWPINDRVSFSSNLNYARPHDGLRSFDEYSASGSFGFVITERVGFYTEGFAFAPQDGSDALRKYFNVGSTLLLSPDLQLDGRVGIGPSTRTGDYFVGIGVVRRW